MTWGEPGISCTRERWGDFNFTHYKNMPLRGACDETISAFNRNHTIEIATLHFVTLAMTDELMLT